ncbi:MAG: hypothetical protein IIT47_03385 [Oscillospiraceae bacterium]|nr:hypothetical protein [Oscillospiraceae bacterium]
MNYRSETETEIAEERIRNPTLFRLIFVAANSVMAAFSLRFFFDRIQDRGEKNKGNFVQKCAARVKQYRQK